MKSYLKYTERFKLMLIMLLTLSCIDVNYTKASEIYVSIEELETKKLNTEEAVNIAIAFIGEAIDSLSDGRSWKECIDRIVNLKYIVDCPPADLLAIVDGLEETTLYTDSNKVIEKLINLKSQVSYNLKIKLAYAFCSYFKLSGQPTASTRKNLVQRLAWNAKHLIAKALQN